MMRAVELFAGAGGLGMGVSRAGFKPVEIIEWNRYCRDTISANRKAGAELVREWPKEILGDVREVDFRPHQGKVQLVSGGPPCQPFSLGGKHRAHTDVRDMFPEAVRAVREIRPACFVFENVKGLTRASFQSYLEYIVLQLQYPEMMAGAEEDWGDHLRRLERHHTGRRQDRGLEYRVVWNVLNAADYGVPQRRERVFFVGFRADLGVEWCFPKPTHSREALAWSQGVGGNYWDRHRVALKDRSVTTGMSRLATVVDKPGAMKAWRSVRDVIHDLPDPELNPETAAGVSNHAFQSGARSYPGHTGSPIDEPAKTLKAGVHGVPGGENMGVWANGRLRYFSVRESARLQTFPDNFVFQGCWSEAMRQLGNAVPVDLAEVVARAVKDALPPAARIA
jgi:DNA (cytosine-5)-methyltransferase 1